MRFILGSLTVSRSKEQYPAWLECEVADCEVVEAATRSWKVAVGMAVGRVVVVVIDLAVVVVLVGANLVDIGGGTDVQFLVVGLVQKATIELVYLVIMMALVLAEFLI